MPRRTLYLAPAAAGVPLFLLVAAAVSQGPSPQNKEAFFAERVAPVLRDHCLECHNPQKSRGGLDLSSRAALLNGGNDGPAVVPGQSKNSPLVTLVSGAKPKMPRQRPALSARQVDDLAKWIDDGAVWPQGVTLAAIPKKAEPDWWSARALTRPAAPTPRDRAWVRNPVDAFVRAKQESEHLVTAPPVDRVTFIRRATFDLHGLPPTPEEIETFVNDQRPGAFERLIDRLLASARYGERWARHWLDIAHYADTHGYDKDKRRLWAWLFRDWVIRAFNTDMPYRRFVRLQLAGDVLEPNDPDGIIATGFVVSGPWDFVGQVELREGTVEKENTRSLDRDDMVANAMSTFCSMTVHCARCHDHKFDPIPQQDYYRLQAVFAGVERGDRAFVSREAQAKRVALAKRRAELNQARAALRQAIDGRATPELRRYEATVSELKKELATFPMPRTETPSPTNGYHSAISPRPYVEKWVQVDLGRSVPLDEIRLIPARPTDFRDAPGFGFPVRFRVAVSDDPEFVQSEVVADHTAADFANPGEVPVSVSPGGKRARFVRVTATRLWERTRDYVFALAEVQVDSRGKNVAAGASVTALDSIEAGRWGRKHLVDNFDSRHRLPDLNDPETAPRYRKVLELRARLRQAEDDRRRLANALLRPAERERLTKLAGEIADVDRQLQGLSSEKIYAVLPIKPRPIHVLHRGDVEKKGELVTPGALSLVRGLNPVFDLKNPADEGSRRAALAEWVVDDRNPLTWRSIANRVWQYHFGRGLVDTPNDFGKNGSPPTHPELLDWLAVEFRDGGGSLKKLHRLIMLSETYRQSCRHHPENAKIDADNRYLWRMNRQRLDAESVRDAVLAVSGKLDLTTGGPGFELFRFKDDHSPVYDHSAVEIINDPKTFRRTIYRFTVRSVPNPFLENLDCADPNINVPVRNTTMTALQALSLLNNPFMVKQSEYFAERLRKISDAPDRQMGAAYRLTFGRPPTADERAELLAYARRHGLANACRVLFNANEFLFVD